MTANEQTIERLAPRLRAGVAAYFAWADRGDSSVANLVREIIVAVDRVAPEPERTP